MLTWTAALVLALFGVTVWNLVEGRDAALERAAAASRNLASALDQHTGQSLGEVDRLLGRMALRLAADPAPAADVLGAEPAPRQVRGLAYWDRDGRPAAGSHAGTVAALPADLLARLRDASAAGLQMATARVDGAPGTCAPGPVVGRRVARPDGSFGGVVAAWLDAGWFQDFYARLEVGPQGQLAVLGLDGGLFLCRAGGAETVPHGLADQPGLRERLLRAEAATLEVRTAPDGPSRITSHRRLADYPVIVLAGLSKPDQLADWRREAVLSLTLAAALAAGALLLSGLFAREMRRRLAAETDARTAATRFRDDKTVLEALLRALPDGIVLIDREGHMRLWNEQLFRVLELDRDPIVAAADPAQAMSDALARRGDGPLTRFNVAAAHAGTSMHETQLAGGKWIECRSTHVRGLGTVTAYREIGERKRREIELEDNQDRLETQAETLRRLADDLDMARRVAEQARIEAETANRTKSSFIAGMNHELRTPLNAILGFAQVIRDLRFGRDALDRYSEYAGHIVAGGEHLLALINDLLDLAKIEAGKMDLERHVLDVNQLVANTLVLVRETAANAGIAVRLETAEEPLFVTGDSRRLKQCFLNLLSNAIKFTPAGGEVVVRILPARDAVKIAVSDTGIGVAPGDIVKIFEPFVQVDSELARRHVGSGLGLPLARSFVELHGGDLSFESEEGAGSTVTVSLPRRRLVA